jgi:hypothetical protein
MLPCTPLSSDLLKTRLSVATDDLATVLTLVATKVADRGVRGLGWVGFDLIRYPTCSIYNGLDSS